MITTLFTIRQCLIFTVFFSTSLIYLHIDVIFYEDAIFKKYIFIYGSLDLKDDDCYLNAKRVDMEVK